MKKVKHAQTKDLLIAIEDMKDTDKLPLDARVEVYIEGQDERYGIVSISHFHFVPNLVLTIKKITDNIAK